MSYEFAALICNFSYDTVGIYKQRQALMDNDGRLRKFFASSGNILEDQINNAIIAYRP